jgi:hypothetical protein
VEPLSVLIRRPPRFPLRTQWLDVPIAGHAGPVNLTWGAFSEIFESCLQGVHRYVGRRVDDLASLEGVVSAVLVENLDVLVSPLGEQAKLGRLFTAADLLIAQRASAGRRQTDGRVRGDWSAKLSDRASDT